MNDKLNKTNLLLGLSQAQKRNMSRLLENQIDELFRLNANLPVSWITSADIRGFSNIVFPIVRQMAHSLFKRYFFLEPPGISLPSGLLFYFEVMV